ncbi:hypothetical protein [Vibrio sp.]|uniref:methylamine utilization protein n=1 Tax=Vibrio sp. TaxID=678 RepID=UPI003D0D2108
MAAVSDTVLRWSIERFIKRSGMYVLALIAVVPAYSKTLHFTDQQGNALANVIVSRQASLPLTASPEPAIMDQVNKSFVPHVLAVQKGQLVSFPNSDNIRHHVYSFSQTKPFEIKLYSGTESEPIMFDKPGIVVLGCNIHDSMVGYIYVSDGEQLWQSDNNGDVTVPDEVKNVSVWHADLDFMHTKRIELAIDNSPESQNVTLQLVALPEPVEKRTFGKRTFGN